MSRISRKAASITFTRAGGRSLEGADYLQNLEVKFQPDELALQSATSLGHPGGPIVSAFGILDHETSACHTDLSRISGKASSSALTRGGGSSLPTPPRITLRPYA